VLGETIPGCLRAEQPNQETLDNNGVSGNDGNRQRGVIVGRAKSLSHSTQKNALVVLDLQSSAPSARRLRFAVALQQHMHANPERFGFPVDLYLWPSPPSGCGALRT
jgi:hypothetical protein